MNRKKKTTKKQQRRIVNKNTSNNTSPNFEEETTSTASTPTSTNLELPSVNSVVIIEDLELEKKSERDFTPNITSTTKKIGILL